MKKLLFAFFIPLMLLSVSCGNSNKNASNSDSDSVATKTDSVPANAERTVTGVAIDGAMNSVDVLVNKDTLSFSFPELESSKRVSWQIGDTITVKYIQSNGSDSVTAMYKGKHA
ncbi:MAG: hypothetical protein LKF31_02530 [Muribaculaceae bacterium]|jgi:hypothetical protein|nr:hypothetical protein [Muribaculaceae bacterium]